jgi:hypothetical protein
MSQNPIGWLMKPWDFGTILGFWMKKYDEKQGV